MEIVPYAGGQLVAPRNDFVAAVAPIVGQYVRQQAIRLGKRAFEAGTEYVSNAINEWWNQPKRPKLSSTQPLTSRGGSMRYSRRTYRRPIRRGRKVIKRRYRRRVTRRYRRRQPSDIVHARFVLSEAGVSNSDPDSWNFVINCNPKRVATDAVTKDSFLSYTTLYDQMRFNMVKFEIWYNDNTPLIAAKPMCRLYSAYDPDNQNRVSSYYNIAKVRPRFTIMRPGRKYKLVMRPKWGITQGNFTHSMYGGEWFDCAFDANKDNYSYNGLLGSIANADVVNTAKDKTQFQTRTIYYMSFRSRRTNQQYSNGETLKRPTKSLDNFIPNLPASH